jgi:hypothetical protein
MGSTTPILCLPEGLRFWVRASAPYVGDQVDLATHSLTDGS